MSFKQQEGDDELTTDKALAQGRGLNLHLKVDAQTHASLMALFKTEKQNITGEEPDSLIIEHEVNGGDIKITPYSGHPSEGGLPVPEHEVILREGTGTLTLKQTLPVVVGLDPASPDAIFLRVGLHLLTMPFGSDGGDQAGLDSWIEFCQALKDRNQRMNLMPLILTPPSSMGSLVRQPARAAPNLHPPRTSPKLQLPAVMNAATFSEAREFQRALGNGPSGRHWEGVEGELALRHAIPGETLQTKYSPSLRLLEFKRWMAKTGSEGTNELLRDELRHLEFDAHLLFGSCLSLVIERGSFNANLDELITLLGWTPRSTVEREKDRLKIWTWLLTFDSMRVVGLRKGSYKDPDDKKLIRDVSCNDDLLHISGTLEDVQPRMDGLPYGVTLNAGPWVDRMRGDKSILSYLGNVRTLAEIPRKKFGARLAAKIGLFLLQEWREKAAHDETQILHPGDENKLSVKFAPTTRQTLLTCYGSEAAREMEDLLASKNPARAPDYWKDAIKCLKEKGIVGYYAEDGSAAADGYGWQDDWYKKQALDIRPGPSIALQVAEINRAWKKAEASRKKAQAAAARQKAKATENN